MMSERIILRVNTFTKFDEFKRIKDYWEKEIPNAIVIPYTFTVENLRELRGKNIADAPSLFKCSVCGWECNDTYTCDSKFKYCPNCGVEMG
jgi:hypothetical protein